MKAILNGRVTSILLVLLFMTVGSSPVIAADVCDKKPDLPKCNPVDPPPDPDPDPDPIAGAACVETELFPAFVYEITQELFLSNAEGDCNISIYRTDGNIMGASNISYRFFGDMDTGNGVGKILWCQRSDIDSSKMQVRMLEFELEDRKILTPLPMTPRVVLEEPYWGEEAGGSLMAPDLSPSGDKMIVSAFTPGEETGYIWEFEIPESGPVEPWTWDVLYTLEADEAQGLLRGTLHRPLYGLDDTRDRVYFSYIHLDRKLVYIQKDPETEEWSQKPVLIAERSDGGNLGPGAIGLWDYGFGLREVLAYPRTAGDIDTIEILDVEACTGSVMPGNGDQCTVVDGLEGRKGTSFTTFTEGSLPALLYLFDVDKVNVRYSLRECNLETLLAGDGSCYRTVIEGIKNRKRTVAAVDSAD